MQSEPYHRLPDVLRASPSLNGPAVTDPAWDTVRGFVPISLCDWPGRTCCVLFVGGCAMRCPTCHNAQLAWRPDTLPPLPRHMVTHQIKARSDWLEGIVISGGEPTDNLELIALLTDLAGLGLPLKVDTNGMRPWVVETILDRGLAQAFSVDVKGPARLYPELSGGRVTAAEAERNLDRLFTLAAQRPGVFFFRQTRVPLLTDADVEESRRWLPAGFPLHEQVYVAPRRSSYAPADSQTGRLPGDLVGGPHRPGHPQSAQGQRDQGSHTGQTAGA